MTDGCNLSTDATVIAHVPRLVLSERHPRIPSHVPSKVIREVRRCFRVSDEPWWASRSPFWFSGSEDSVHDLVDPE